MKKTIALISASLSTLLAAAPALADVVVDPFYSLHSTKSWVLWVSIGIAAIALAVLILLVLRERRKK